MPTILKRFRPDSIREFRAAARVRHIDGNRAEEAGRRTAAIYLWGHAAEMILKAADFSAIRFPETRPILLSDLKEARNSGINVHHVNWPEAGKFHNIRAWAELLVEYRSQSPGFAYARPGFGEEIRHWGRQIEPIWSETLRYHKNVAYRSEVEKMSEATRWLLANSPLL